jgi:hypothetical protein
MASVGPAFLHDWDMLFLLYLNLQDTKHQHVDGWCSCPNTTLLRRMLCRLWELVDADTWTFEFMENNPTLFPWAHFPAVLLRFHSLMREAPLDIRKFLMSADVHGNSLIPFRTFHVRPSTAQINLYIRCLLLLTFVLAQKANRINRTSLWQEFRFSEQHK